MDPILSARFDDCEGISLSQGESRTITMTIYQEKPKTPIDLTGAIVSVNFPYQGGGAIKRTNGPVAVNTTNVAIAPSNTITVNGHGFTTGDPVTIAAIGGGVLPTGLAALTNYLINVIDNNNFQLTNTSGVVVSITAQGSGSFNITNATDVVLVSGDLGQVTLTLRSQMTQFMNPAIAQNFQVSYVLGGLTRIIELPALLEVQAQFVP